MSAFRAFATDWRGFLVTRERPIFRADIFWTASRLELGWLIELAGQGTIDTNALLPKGDVLEAFDKARGTRRIAVRAEDGTLAAALFLTRSGSLARPRLDCGATLGGARQRARTARRTGRSANI